MTVTIFTSTSEAKTAGYRFSTLQFEVSSFFNSEIDSSVDTHHSFIMCTHFGKILKRNFGFQEGRESSGLRRPVWKKVRLVVEFEEEQQMEDSEKRRPPMQFN